MLSNLLALMVGSGGLALIAGAFLAPKLYRNNDLIWGGVALFYGVVLWFCSTQIHGAVLLGDSAAVSLIGWLGWQAFLGRWGSLSDADRAQLLDGSAIQRQFKALTSGQTLPGVVAPTTASKAVTPTPPIAQASEAIDAAQSQVQAAVQSSTKAVQKTVQDAAKVNAPGGDRPAVTDSLRKGLDQAGAPALIATVTGAIGSLRDRIQGRKSPGRRYVRPEAAAASTDKNATYEEDWTDVVEETIEDAAEELNAAAAPIVQEMDTVEEPIVEDPDQTVIEVDESIEAAQEAVTEAIAETVAEVAPPSESAEPSQPGADEDWDI
jgi:Ycf66 protein N-terminus